MQLYVQVAVKHRRNVKEAFVQYRIICNQPQSASLERVLEQYRKTSEEKLHEAIAASTKTDATAPEAVAPIPSSSAPVDMSAEVAAEAETVDVELPPVSAVGDDEDVDELDFESLMLQTVSGEDAKVRKDRQITTPWVKYMWETYRTILDVLRNNAKLQGYYHTTARTAFQFCAKYKRTTEFRRLCDIIRNHLDSVVKYSHQTNAVDLNAPETQRLYLETRFEQLKIAAELELWQEAYRTIEDIHEGMSRIATPPEPVLIKTFYDMLARIFWASDNLLFHAYTLFQFYKLSVASDKNMEPAAKKQLASAVLLASLAIPPSSDAGDEGGVASLYEEEGNVRLASLLGFRKEAASRARLLKDLQSEELLSQVDASTRAVFDLLETRFGPLQLQTSLQPLLANLQPDATLSKYVEPLQTVTTIRVLQQLSTVFTSIKLEYFRSLVPALPGHSLERLIVHCARHELAPARIDHRQGLLHFTSEGMEATRMRTQLAVLAQRLQEVADKVSPAVQEERAQHREIVYGYILEGLEQEHQSVAQRMLDINRRKQVMENYRAAARRREAELHAHAARVAAEEEIQRLQREAALRKEEQAKKEKREAENKLKKQQLEQIIKRAQTSQLSADTLDRLQQLLVRVDQVDQPAIDRALRDVNEEERLKKDNRHLDAWKTLDYFVRAVREEEREKLSKQLDVQRVAERDQTEMEFKRAVEAAQAQHQMAIGDKSRLVRMTAQKTEFVQKVMARRQAAFQQQKAAWDERERARQELRRQQEEEEAERRRQQQEEEERQRQEEEEEEQRQQEEAARLAEEQRAAEEAAAKVYRPPVRAQAPPAAAPAVSAPSEPRRPAYEPRGPPRQYTDEGPSQRETSSSSGWRRDERPAYGGGGAGGFSRSQSDDLPSRAAPSAAAAPSAFVPSAGSWRSGPASTPAPAAGAGAGTGAPRSAVAVPYRPPSQQQQQQQSEPAPAEPAQGQAGGEEGFEAVRGKRRPAGRR